MGPALELTSVPPWTVTPTQPPADVSGRSWAIVAFGDDTESVVSTWSEQLAAAYPDQQPRVYRVGDDAEAAAALTNELATAVVGWRLMVAGPAVACLRLRARALARGVAEDEITIATTDVAIRDVQCVHCRTVTTAAVGIEDTVECSGCGRNLLVYYHVSRLQGAHLGFMVDAERLPEEVASR
jgi:hypothetical protein